MQRPAHAAPSDLVRAVPRPGPAPFVARGPGARSGSHGTRLYRVAGAGLAAYGVRDGDGLVVRCGGPIEHGDLVVLEQPPEVVSHFDGRDEPEAMTPEGCGPTVWVWRDGRPALLVTALLTALAAGPLDPAKTGVVVAVLRREPPA